MLTTEQIIDRLPDPDEVGQSEYRAVCEVFVDAINGYEDDSGLTPSEFAQAILDEIEKSTRTIRYWLLATSRVG
jgi:hypothetical protein